MNATRAVIRLIILPVLLVGVSMATVGCRRTYDQSSAEAVMESARAMVEDGNVGQLTRLVYAKNEQERAMFDKCGYVLDRMYRLSERIREEYPEEVAELKDEAVQKAEEVAEAQDRRREDGGAQWQVMLAGFLADPFGMLDEQMARVDVVEIDDLQSAVTVDGKPAFGVGLVIRKGDGDDPKWYFQLPTNIPVLNQQMPQTDAEWQIIGAMLKSVANSVSWIEESIDSGEVESLKGVGQEAFEMVAPTLFMQWSLYDRAVKARPKEGDREQEEDGAKEKNGEG